MSIVLEEKDYIASSLSRKVLGRKMVDEHAAEEAEDKNFVALLSLAEAVKAVAEKPQPSFLPVLAALQRVQETQSEIVRLLAVRERPEQIKEWEFNVTHDNRGDIKCITAHGTTSK